MAKAIEAIPVIMAIAGAPLIAIEVVAIGIAIGSTSYGCGRPITIPEKEKE